MAKRHKPHAAPAGKQITLTEARGMIEAYSKNCSDNHIHSIKISTECLKAIIAQDDCAYVRFFIAVDGNLKPEEIGVVQGHTLVVVGADSEGRNILRGENDSQVYEDMSLCPVECSGGDGYSL